MKNSAFWKWIAEDEDLNPYDFGECKMGRTARGERKNMKKEPMVMQKKMKKKKMHKGK